MPLVQIILAMILLPFNIKTSPNFEAEITAHKNKPRWEMRPPIYPPMKRRMVWLREKPYRAILLYIPLALVWLLPAPKWLTVLSAWFTGMFMALTSVFLDLLEADKGDLTPQYEFWKRYDNPPENIKQFLHFEPRPRKHKLIAIWPIKPATKTKTQRWLDILDAIHAIPNCNQIPYEELSEILYRQGIDVSTDTLHDIQRAVRTGQLWYSKEYHGL